MGEKTKSLRDWSPGERVGPQLDRLVLEADLGGGTENVAVRIPARLRDLTHGGAATLQQEGSTRQPGPHVRVLTDEGNTVIHVERLHPSSRELLLQHALDPDSAALLAAWERAQVGKQVKAW
jgi:hypothetical protein